MKSTHAALAAAALFFAASGWAQHGDHKMVSPNDLKWSDVPSLPPGAKIAVIEGPTHSHPAVERVTVLTGTVHMGTGDKLDKQKTTPLSAGSIGIMQPKTNHFVWTQEEVIVQLNGMGPWGVTYVNPADDPRKNEPLLTP